MSFVQKEESTETNEAIHTLLENSSQVHNELNNTDCVLEISQEDVNSLDSARQSNSSSTIDKIHLKLDEFEHLINYYKHNEIINHQIDNKNFSQLNTLLCEFIKEELSTFDNYVKDFTERFFHSDPDILIRWDAFKEFLLNGCIIEDDLFKNELLDLAFRRKLYLLAVGNKFNICLNVSLEDIETKSKTLLDFARAFITFILDAHLTIVLNDSEPWFKLSIYFYEADNVLYDHDIYFHFGNMDLEKDDNDTKQNDNQESSSRSHMQEMELEDSENKLQEKHEQANNNKKQENQTDDSLTEIEDNVNASLLEGNKEEKENYNNEDNNSNVCAKQIKEHGDVQNFENIEKSSEYSQDDLNLIQNEEFVNSAAKEPQVNKKQQKIIQIKEAEEINQQLKIKYSQIRNKFNLTSTTSEQMIFGFIILNISLLQIVKNVFFAGMSVIDVTLDLLMIYDFWMTEQKMYSLWTAIILIGSGLCNIFAERKHLFFGNTAIYLKDQKKVKSSLFRDLFSFLQVSVFFKTVKYSWSLFKRKRQPITKQMLDNLTDAHPEFLVEDVVILKHIETYLEANPQTILQCSIMMYNQEWNLIPILKIIMAVISINVTTLTSMAYWTNTKLLQFLNLKNVLMIVTYNCSFLLSYVLLFYKLPAISVFLLIILHIYIGYYCKKNPGDDTLLFKSYRVKKFSYWKIFNIFTIIEHFLCIMLLSLLGGDRIEFQIVLAIYVVLYLIWVVLVTKNNFKYRGNVMYLPYFARDRWND